MIVFGGRTQQGVSDEIITISAKGPQLKLISVDQVHYMLAVSERERHTHESAQNSDANQMVHVSKPDVFVLVVSHNIFS